MQDNSIFSSINGDLVSRLLKDNITEPTKVQAAVIPSLLEGKNLVFQSETGTGKTLAYLLPLLTNLIEKEKNENPNEKHVRIIITSPTFELSSQIKQTVMNITDLKSALFIGGSPIKRQIEALKEKCEIIIGTPARLVELIQLKKLKTQYVEAIVFDEADRLVKKELVDETSKLLKAMPEKAQVVACTATIDGGTKKFFKNSEFIMLPQEDVLAKNITHWAIYAENRNKIEMLRKLLLSINPEKALIFTSRADQVENIYSKLKFKKIDVYALHAKTDKQLRKATIDRFKSGKIKMLVTSDLSARGLDIQNITHVIQMDLPSDTDFFVHRAGRTARAGKKGINIVIGDEYEMRNYSMLEKKLKITVYPKIIRDGKVTDPEL